MTFYRSSGKRLFDVCAAAVGILLFSPILLIISIIIKLKDKGPLFFLQERVGKDFISFKLFKFRTMIVNADKMGAAITKGEDPRITGIGRMLRNYKLDELPQLINVLRGDMSLVGPRPEVEKYVMLFRNEYQRILSIRPGITDFAALEFRDEEKILNNYKDADEGYIKEILPAKIKLYEQYLEQIGFATDLKIIIKTFQKIFS